jgi:hypothetical protein
MRDHGPRYMMRECIRQRIGHRVDGHRPNLRQFRKGLTPISGSIF